MRIRWARAALCGLVVLSTAASPAGASRGLETGIADDALLLYSSSRVAERTVAAWQRAGVDVVRLHVRWAFVAPKVHNTRVPAGFDPRDPQDRNYNWGAIDRAIGLLEAAGIRPMATITGSGPVWGTRFPDRRDARYEPDPRSFGDFVHAVAARYDGRIHRYLIWNEPNQAAWLKPQYTCKAGRCIPRAPHIYRNLYRAAEAEIRDVDPTAQVIIGNLAPRGHRPIKANVPMRPLAFLRALGCVDVRYRRDRTGSCRTAEPISADGFAYHPHPVQLSPDQHARNADDASIADLGRLEKAIDRTTAHGILRSGHGPRLDVYLTEFGYQTNPPDRDSGVTPRQQVRWVQQATYTAFRDPRVKNLTAYLWRDEPLKPTPSRYAAWQSGTYFSDGRRKPLRAAFDHPFHVDVRRGRASLFWGQVRPGTLWSVRIQRRLNKTWRTMAVVKTNSAGYFTYARRLGPAASYRFQYSAPREGSASLRVSSATQYVRAAR